MIYIIMCGGEYSKWESPRQLIQIGGEPVVVRTIRLLKEAGAEEIYISTNDDRFSEYAPLLKHDNDFRAYIDGCWVDAFYPTMEPACYIFGDVVFSHDAIKTIVTDQTGGIQFYASCPPFHPLYIKKYAEPFAFKVVDQVRFRSAINYIKANLDIFNRHPIAWELWQIVNGWEPNEIYYGSYVAINDYTCDIDSPKDAEKISEVLA